GQRARVAAADPAVAAQHVFLEVQDELLLTLDCKVGAVGAVVAQHELLTAPLDRAVLPRCVFARHDDVAFLVAADLHDRVPARYFRAAMLQPQLTDGHVDAGAGHVRDVGTLPPDELAQGDAFRLAFELDGI